MLSQRQRSLDLGRESPIDATPADLRPLLALPPHPQALLAGLRPALQHQFGVRHPPSSRYIPRQSTTSPRDYAVASVRGSLSKQETEEKGRRSIMYSDPRSTSPPSTRTLLTLRLHGQVDSSFSFQTAPRPDMILSFPPRPSPPRPEKRGRAVTDVDGELSCLHKKKRRLRLFLITSRLSPEFSSPATNIVDRGNSKIAVWAKQKALGRNLLRKAAILNHIRRTNVSTADAQGRFGASPEEQERVQKQLELARLAFVYGSHDTHTRPVIQRTGSSPPATAVRVGDHFDLSGSPSPESSSPNFTTPSSAEIRDEHDDSTYRSPNDAYAYVPTRAQSPRKIQLPLPPSPLGLSNYDAFDLEESFPDPYAHFDDDDEEEDETFAHDSEPHSPSAHTSASYTSTLSTAGTGASEPTKTPPQMIYSDFSKLDPGEPVFGDYDQVDEGADAVWPNPFASEYAQESSAPSTAALGIHPASCSPNIPALFATTESAAPASCSPNFSSSDGMTELKKVDSLDSGQWSLQDSFDKRTMEERTLQEERLRQLKVRFPQYHPAP